MKKEVYMVSKFAFWALFVMLLSGTALAIHDASYGGYSGQTSRERRADDPFSRQQYFGEDYYRPFANFGAKGPTNRLVYTGAKSAYSASFNLDTNTFTNQGRNPGAISNYDPRVLGYSRVDKTVDLLPFSPVAQEFAGVPFLGRGTARILSLGNSYGAGLNKASPRTQVFVQLRNLPPLAETEIYEAWLFDKDSEYSLSIGLLKSGIQLTSQLESEINRATNGFDAVMITREAFPDIDPSPGEIVLIGDIGPSRQLTDNTGAYFQTLR